MAHHSANSPQTAKIVVHYFEFGPFRLDVIERVLLRDDERVLLRPKAFETLLSLVQNSGRVLDKKDLIDKIWADRYVEEATLAQNIFTLRRILGENAAENRFIETVPGRGYRFVSEVKEFYGEVPKPATLVPPSRTAAASIAASGLDQDQPEPAVPEDPPLAIAVEAPPEKSEADATDISPPRRGFAFQVVVAAVSLLAFVAMYFWLNSAERDEALPNNHLVSIAVLPFEPLYPEQGDDSLGLGIANAVITKLSNSDRMMIRPTSTILKYVGARPNSVAAGKELQVGFVLEGGTQIEGSQVRLSVQLVRVRDSVPLWSQTFDADLSNKFSLEDSLSDQVVRALMAKLESPDERLKPERREEAVH
jgi:DNA-binding winged helix-turn-helix (wHTH) protein/TolB-like protein